MPEISVIVPVYRVEPYLRRCVDSILSQTFTDFELILVDDGSPDNCGAICDEYALKDSRVRVIHKQNGGLSDARNAGINWVFKYSNNKWLTFIDSDDWVHCQYLEILLHLAKRHKAKVSICDFLQTSKNIISQDISCAEYMISPEDLYYNNRIGSIVSWGKLYRKECFSKIRYPVGKLHEDEFTTYKILFSEKNIAYTKSKLYYYYINNDSIMHTTWSIKRLDALFAHREQMAYFMKNGLQRAYLRATRAYVGTICNYCDLLQKENHRTALEKQLRKELRHSLRKYKEQVPINECRWAYSVAYPHLIKFYNTAELFFQMTRRIIYGKD